MKIDAKVRRILIELGFPPSDGRDTPVFIFSSTELKHVWIAVKRRMWAIADIGLDQLAARITKATELPLGADGLFYSSDEKCFTVPFRIQSQPEFRSVSDVWPGVWHFPFEIQPLGTLARRIPLSTAKARWRTLKGAHNVTKRINISGNMAFVPSWFYKDDWEAILRDLAIVPEDPQQAS